MSGFFLVSDVPARRVVQYKRVSSTVDGAIYLADDSLLGKAVDAMPFVDKTGLGIAVGGTLYEVPYLPDAGAVYFVVQPYGASGNADALHMEVEAKAGKAPYSYQWYKDDKQVVNVPAASASLTVTETGKYWCVATDADGVQAVSEAADVEFTEEVK
ncbi:Hoc-like head decoration [Serratia phage Eta]|uniref:Ig-like domain-containing protein n=1 Tax=Serratia phage Eta TaxID=1282995 RepID=R9VYK6_9CAUD|nr:Hoc-like head decoration [Serratia phage Eta]AGN89490.1 hypothetical protein Eta_0044 [Serratia phage Eta]